MSQDPGGKSEIIRRAGMLLACSNVFMTFAWYAHPAEPGEQAMVDRRGGELGDRAARVPASGPGQSDRLHHALSLGQLEILQEVITLAVFVPFAVLCMREPLKPDYAWAALCLIGAVYFVFRAHS